MTTVGGDYDNDNLNNPTSEPHFLHALLKCVKCARRKSGSKKKGTVNTTTKNNNLLF
jgi:hypothetical protein